VVLTINDLIPFVAVGAAAVTALSTITGVRLANRAAEMQLKLTLEHQDKKDQKEALRHRLEELYQLVDSWAGTVVGHHITYRSAMYGEITYNQALDITSDRKPKADSTRMFTLAELYFPDSHSLLEAIKSSRDVLAGIQEEYKSVYKEIGPAADGTKYSKMLSNALIQFNDAIKLYKESISIYAREV